MPSVSYFYELGYPGTCYFIIVRYQFQINNVFHTWGQNHKPYNMFASVSYMDISSLCTNWYKLVYISQPKHRSSSLSHNTQRNAFFFIICVCSIAYLVQVFHKIFFYFHKINLHLSIRVKLTRKKILFVNRSFFSDRTT